MTAKLQTNAKVALDQLQMVMRLEKVADVQVKLLIDSGVERRPRERVEMCSMSGNAKLVSFKATVGSEFMRGWSHGLYKQG